MGVERIARDKVSRGCGSRKAGGVYLCTAMGGKGMPLEYFLIDPVQKFEVDCFRAPIVVDDPNDSTLKHLAIWVGKEHYPSLVDYVEETKRLGASRRIPEDFDFSVLTPGRSRMFLIHPLAFTELINEAACPQDRGEEGHGTTVACIGAHWRYAKSMGSQVTEAPEGDSAVIGECSYHLNQPQIEVDLAQFSPGAFLQLPITHIEYQAHDRADTGPDNPKDRAVGAGFDYVIVDDL